MRSALLYDLYFSTLGGGERYAVAFADVMSRSRPVELASPHALDLQRAERLGFPRLHVRRVPPVALPLVSRRRPLLVYVANGVPLPSLAKRSIAIVQFPMRNLPQSLGVLQRNLLRSYELVVYSEYVRHWVRERWQRDAIVIPPPVTLGTWIPEAKEPIILGVGRFFTVQHSKRQDVLIEAFRRWQATSPSGWKLVLAGSRSPGPGTDDYLARLRAAAIDLPVEILVDIPEEELRALYRRASIFWHAAGYGRDELAPEQAEHFGMSTVEAMSYGCVPLVYDDGGQREILSRGGGILWRSVEELVAKTLDVVESSVERRVIAERAVASSKAYGLAVFEDAVTRLINGRDERATSHADPRTPRPLPG